MKLKTCLEAPSRFSSADFSLTAVNSSKNITMLRYLFDSDFNMGNDRQEWVLCNLGTGNHRADFLSRILEGDGV